MVNEERLKLAVAEIRQRLKLSTVLTREGVMHVPYRGLLTCVFHADSRPSMSIDNERGVFYCFSCGRKGDVIKLVQECEAVLHGRNRSFTETVDLLIRSDEELANALGFTTVSQEDTKEFRLPRADNGSIVWQFGKERKPKRVDTLTVEGYGRKLRQSGDINQIMAFIGYCEKGYPIDVIVDLCNGTGTEVPETSLKAFDTDVLDDFSILFE